MAIKFSKEEYDTKMGYAQYMSQYIGDLKNKKQVLKMTVPETCESSTINDFKDIYDELGKLIDRYLAALNNTAISLKIVGEEIYDADQKLKEGFENK